jgi:hypothetical protein
MLTRILLLSSTVLANHAIHFSAYPDASSAPPTPPPTARNAQWRVLETMYAGPANPTGRTEITLRGGTFSTHAEAVDEAVLWRNTRPHFEWVADYELFPDDGFPLMPPWDSGAGPNRNLDNDDDYKYEVLTQADFESKRHGESKKLMERNSDGLFVSLKEYIQPLMASEHEELQNVRSAEKIAEVSDMLVKIEQALGPDGYEQHHRMTTLFMKKDLDAEMLEQELPFEQASHMLLAHAQLFKKADALELFSGFLELMLDMKDKSYLTTLRDLLPSSRLDRAADILVVETQYETSYGPTNRHKMPFVTRTGTFSRSDMVARHDVTTHGPYATHADAVAYVKNTLVPGCKHFSSAPLGDLDSVMSSKGVQQAWNSALLDNKEHDEEVIFTIMTAEQFRTTRLLDMNHLVNEEPMEVARYVWNRRFNAKPCGDGPPGSTIATDSRLWPADTCR